jgi:hypothetical protein
MLLKFDNTQFLDKNYFSKFFNVSPRQASYYLDALIFIGIIDYEQQLTYLGKVIRESRHNEEEACHYLRNAILNKAVFKQVYECYMNENVFPSEDYISKMIVDYYALADSTAKRRSSTVKKWIEWAINVK